MRVATAAAGDAFDSSVVNFYGPAVARPARASRNASGCDVDGPEVRPMRPRPTKRRNI
jgi:hypothetical protein